MARPFEITVHDNGDISYDAGVVHAKAGEKITWILKGDKPLVDVECELTLMFRGSLAFRQRSISENTKSGGITITRDLADNVPTGSHPFSIEGHIGKLAFQDLNCPEIIIQNK